MLFEATDVVAAALRDATIGVNAQLGQVYRRPGDAAPAPLQSIATEFDDDRTASGEAPNKQPGVTVSRNGPAVIAGEGLTREIEEDVPVGVAVRLWAQVPPGARGARLVEYYLAAIVRSLTAMLGNGYEAMRTRGDVYVIAADTIAWTPIVEANGQSQVVGAVVVNLIVQRGAA